MNTISELLRSDFVHRVGWALLHSVWQIAALACLVAVLLALLRRRSANLRYLIGCGGLAAMLLLPLATYGLLPGRPDGEAAAFSMSSGNRQLPAADAASPQAAPPRAVVYAAPPHVPVPNATGPLTAPAAFRGEPPGLPSETAAPLAARITRAVSPWLPRLAAAWFIGVFLLSVWHVGGWVALVRLKRVGTRPAPEQWTRRLADLAGRMGLGRRVEMLLSTLVDAPSVVGWLRPVVLAPAGMFGEMSLEQIDAVLAHELAHVRRYDYLVNLMQTLVETLLFYHPAVWWLSRRVRAEREHCCDDAAVAVCGSRVAYAEALAAVEQSRSTPELAMTARGDRAGTALARVRRILRGADEGTLRRGSLLAGTSAALVLVGAIAGYLAFTGKPTKAEIEATRNEATGESTTTTDDPPAQPRVAWYVKGTSDKFFGIEDIVRFDWDRQVFELTRQRAMDLMGRRSPHRGSLGDFEVRDQRGVIYEGKFISPDSSIPYEGPTIFTPRLELTLPPLYAIEGGYPDSLGPGEKTRFAPRLKEALRRAGKLAKIPENANVPPIEQMSTEWVGQPEVLRVRAEIFPETFRIGDFARAHVFFATPDGTAPFTQILVETTVTANGGKFVCKTDYPAESGEALEKILEAGVQVLRWKPWGPAFGSEEQTPDPGEAEIRFHVVARQAGDKPAAMVDLAPLKVTLLAAAEPDEAKRSAISRFAKTYDLAGQAIEAGFIPDDAEIILGQPSFVTFTVTNRSEKPYRFMIGGDMEGSVRHNNFRITAVDAEGQPVKDPYSYNNFGGPTPEVRLKPGATHTERLFLGHWLAFQRPGTYTVTCRRTLEDYGQQPRLPKLPIETQFKLVVLPFDRAKMQRVIARFGKDVRDGDQQELYDATIALASLDEPAVIPHLAASVSRGDYQNQIPAVEGLGRFSTDAAGDALREAMKDPDHAVREAAGRALQKTKQVDRVVEILLEKLGDASPEVRRAAATALGQTGSAAAVEPLIAALDDPESPVAQAAAVSLGDLGDRRAAEPLHRRLHGAGRGLRVAAADGLRRLTGKLDPAWLAPTIRETTDINDQTFHESIRLIRVYGGKAAAPALIGCLKLDDPSPRSSYNFFLILAIHHAEDGPDCYYRWKHDPNTDGTLEQIDNNRQILEELKAWTAERSGGTVSTAMEASGGERPKHHFAIYRVLGHRSTVPFGGERTSEKREILFSEEGDDSRRFDAMRPENYPLDGLILDKTPLLTEADIVAYVWPKHEIHLKPGVRERLLREIKPSVWGVPFAVVAEGKPAYLGAFWTAASSYSADMPTISVDGWQWTLPETEPHYLPKDAIRIDLSQILEPGEPPTDARDNRAVREALKQAGKLTDRTAGADGGPPSEGSEERADEADAASWGPAVEGVQLRVRAEKPKWPQGTVPKLLADLRNQGQRTLGIRIEYLSWQIEIDGKWFESDVGWSGRRNVLPLDAGTEQRDLEVLVHPDDARGRALRALTPGKHTLRVARLLPSAVTSAQWRLRVVSKPVEIEIVGETDKQDGATQEGNADSTAAEPSAEAANSLGVAEPDQPPTEAALGPVIERIVNFDVTEDGAYLDLDTGKQDGNDPRRDLIAAAGGSDTRVRSGLDMVAIAVDAGRWNATADEILAEVAKGEPQRQVSLGGPESRRTFFFKTREGGVGVLRIVPMNDEQGNVKVLYKMLQAASRQTAWGPAVDGVQARLRPDKAAWESGEVPTLKADIRNSGTRDLSVARAQQLCELEVDGRWYGWVGDIHIKSSWFPPGREYDDIAVSLVSDWHAKQGGQPLELGPGKHTVRVAFVCQPTEAGSSSTGPGTPVRAVSNPVEIEIAAPPLLRFGPVSDTAIRDMRSARDCFIDFDTGRVMGWPAEGLPPFDPQQGVTEALKQFMRSNGLDAIGWLPRSGPVFEGLLGLDMKVVDVADTRWLVEADPAGVRSPLSDVRRPGETVPISGGKPAVPADDARKAFLFQTREGALGKLRLNLVINGSHVEVSYQRVWQPAELSEWSDPGATGLRLRLRPNAAQWAVGETPALMLDLWNDSDQDSPFMYNGLQEVECELEYDGQWYRWADPVFIRAPGRLLRAHRADNGAVAISLVRSWARTDRSFTGEAEDSRRLKLTPGRHSVRALFTAGYLRDAGRKVRVVSKPIEIEIAPGNARPDTHSAAGAADTAEATAASPATADPPARKIHWGRPSNGLEAGLAFDPQERPYHMGETVGFRLHVRNAGDKPVVLIDVGTQGWLPTVHDAAGKPVLVAGVFDGPVERRRRTLSPGQVVDLGAIELRLDKTPEERAAQPPHAHLKPGTYRVSQTYRFADDAEATWSGELTTADLELVVLPAEAAAE